MGDMLLQHVMVTFHSLYALQVTSCALHCTDKLLPGYWRIVVKIFVCATEFCPVTKFCCGDKHFHRISRKRSIFVIDSSLKDSAFTAVQRDAKI